MRTLRRIAVPIGGLVAVAMSLPGPAALAQTPPAGSSAIPSPPSSYAEWRKDYTSRFHVSQRVWPLASNTTQEFRLPIEHLEVGGDGVLWDCWGFEIKGPGGIRYEVADLGFFGPVAPWPGHESEPTGGRGAAVRLPDGSLEVPESHAKLTPAQLLGGWLCRVTGWAPSRPYDGQIKARFRGQFARLHSQTPRAIRSRAALRRRLAREARALPFTVQLAALYHHFDGRADIVLRVRTGEIPAGTTVRGRARVIITKPRVAP